MEVITTDAVCGNAYLSLGWAGRRGRRAGMVLKRCHFPAISFPHAVAIFSGSGWIPTLPKSNRSASKQASMVGLPVLRVEVC